MVKRFIWIVGADGQFSYEGVQERRIRDICATTNTYVKHFYELPGKKDKLWGDADIIKLFSLLNMRPSSE